MISKRMLLNMQNIRCVKIPLKTILRRAGKMVYLDYYQHFVTQIILYGRLGTANLSCYFRHDCHIVVNGINYYMYVKIRVIWGYVDFLSPMFQVHH